MGSMPAIQPYKNYPQRAIIHEVTGLNGWAARDPRTRWQPCPHPQGHTQIWLREVVGLDASYGTVYRTSLSHQNS